MVNELKCRICSQIESNNNLINACDCGQKLKYVHFNCLTDWMRRSGEDICQLCKSKFKRVQYIKESNDLITFLYDFRKTFWATFIASYSILLLVMSVWYFYNGLKYYFYPLDKSMYLFISLNERSIKKLIAILFRFVAHIIMPGMSMILMSIHLLEFYICYRIWQIRIPRIIILWWISRIKIYSIINAIIY